MKIILIRSLSILFFTVQYFNAFPQAMEQKQSALVAKGATIVKAGTGYSFTEGPAVDPKGNVFFTDQPNDKILKWSTDGNISVYM